jgi:hypothetical protein
MLDKIVGWMKGATEAGVALIALAIVLQVIFGGTVPFIGGDIIGTITGIVAQLGAQGLVGLIAALVLYKIFNKD